MAVLQDDRYQEIAQWVTATQSTKGLTAAWKFRLKDAGFTVDELQRYGPAFTHDAYIVAFLISSGRVNSKEANAFLAQKYPDLKYGGDRFGDVRGGQAAEKAIEASSKATGDPEAKTVAQTARDEQVKAGIGSPFSNPEAGVPVQYSLQTPRVPDTYDAKQMGKALRDITEQASLAITAVANGAVRFQPNSLPGHVIAPGSLSATKLDPVSLARAYRDLPGPDQAIRLRVAPDYSTDREFQFSDGTNVDASRSGPGRVWRVVTAEYPQDFNPTPGPQRYRLVTKDLRFGIFSLLQNTPYTAGSIAVRYGLVLRDIPTYLGRIPSAILYTGFVGDTPTSLVADNINTALGGGRVTKLFHGTATTAGRAYDQFVTNASLGWEPYGSGTACPTSAELASVEGVNFMLVTGRSAEEVYAQMNSAPSVNYARINGDSRGPTASCPPGTYMDSPFPAALARRDAAGPNYFNQLETDAMTTLGRALQWQEGVPMSYAACQRLRSTNDYFSVAIQPSFVKTVAFASTIESIATWDTLGIRSTTSNNRELSIDIVVV